MLAVFSLLTSSRFFFFFQAEDGIRDWSVTGVQTCALPISPGGRLPRRHEPQSRPRRLPKPPRRPDDNARSRDRLRSEERRVGKSVDLGGRRIIKKKKREANDEE